MMDERNARGEARTLGVPGNDAGGSGRHSLQVLNREQVLVQGVLAVESFDDEEIIMETDLGTLTLRGEDLHIKQLDLETGKFAVEGCISACIYSTPRQRGGRPVKSRGLLDRLLR
jgi:sporulation protein YabP